jgi:hypothetical protein
LLTIHPEYAHNLDAKVWEDSVYYKERIAVNPPDPVPSRPFLTALAGRGPDAGPYPYLYRTLQFLKLPIAYMAS